MEYANEKNYTDKFKNLVEKKQATIGNIEKLIIDEVNEYKKHIENVTEHLIANEINEKELIKKKRTNG